MLSDGAHRDGLRMLSDGTHRDGLGMLSDGAERSGVGGRFFRQRSEQVAEKTSVLSQQPERSEQVAD